MPDNSAAHGPITTSIDGAGVVRLLTDVINLIEFDQVFVAAKSDGHMWCVMDQVVCDPIANTVNRYSRLIHPLPSTIVMNVVVIGQMTSRFQFRSIATVQVDPTASGLRDFATDHPVVDSAFDLDSPTAYVPDGTTDNSIMRTVL